MNSTNKHNHAMSSDFNDIPPITEESRILAKIKQSPILPVATLGFLGIGGYRIYHAQQRGGMKLSMFLIHTRLAAQGFGVAVLGTMVLYSMAQRIYDHVMHIERDEDDYHHHY